MCNITQMYFQRILRIFDLQLINEDTDAFIICNTPLKPTWDTHTHTRMHLYTCAHMTALTALGGISNASTIPATDAEALDNARRGLMAAAAEAAAAEKASTTTSESTRPAPLLRVNSVPLLSTPPDKIRRTMTPLALAAAPAATTSAPAADASSTSSPSTGDTSTPLDEPVTSASKKEVKLLKKKKKGKAQKSTQPHGAVAESGPTQPPPPDSSGIPPQNAAPASEVNSGDSGAAQPNQDAGSKESELPPCDDANKENIPTKADPENAQTKATASKSAAKPVKKPAQDESKPVKAEPVTHSLAPETPQYEKVVNHPTRDQITGDLATATHENLKRANTNQQFTPSAANTPAPAMSPADTPGGNGRDDAEKPADKSNGLPSDDDEDAGDDAEEDLDGEDIEEELERELARSSQTGPGFDDGLDDLMNSPTDTTPRDKRHVTFAVDKSNDDNKKDASGKDGDDEKEPEVKPSNAKRRREKTKEEKAAHARFMRFSRSFASPLLQVSLFPGREVALTMLICAYYQFYIMINLVM